MNVQTAAEQVQKVQHAIDNACAQIRAACQGPGDRTTGATSDTREYRS